MKKHDLHTVEKMLSGFDALGSIEAGPEWEQQLLAKMKAPQGGIAGNGQLIRAAAFVALFILLNIGLLLHAGKESAGNTGNAGTRTEMLNIVSDQLLVNPNALN